MAATDQTYRAQSILDIVFGVSCVLMLLSIIWMFAQDYYREFKVEARDFRDVEEAMATRELLRKTPKPSAVDQAETKLKEARDLLAAVQKVNDKEATSLTVDKVDWEAKAQATKAEFDSKKSIREIETDKRNRAEPGSTRDQLAAEVARLDDTIAYLERLLAERQRQVDEIAKKMDALKNRQVEVEVTVAKEKVNKTSSENQAKKMVDDAEKEVKALTDEFDRFAKLAVQKRWKLGDRIRALPVLDAFASPTKIDQLTLADLPIDYNFKHVTRFDRCTTCHLGIERPTYTREALRGLKTEVSATDTENLRTALSLFQDRQKIFNDKKAVGFDFEDLRLRALSKEELPETRINEYCVHPRLDLFVAEKSAHPKEKFGCSICHAGQGSATDFVLASHTPNNAREKKRWESAQSWRQIHDWEFPMLPKRFVEAACLKCHHQVTDLMPKGEAVEYRGTREAETPGAKVTRGYNLVRENGCFGCHEISGIKNNRWVGPDLRLEPVPPLDALTPGERAQLEADPLNPPGTMRKVGPSLQRISEKTNQQWVRRWLQEPRGFRPDTKMPHFFNLSNNRPEVLPEDQKGYPAAEMHGIAFYLFQESADYLQGKDAYVRLNKERLDELQKKQKDVGLNETENKELEDATRRLEVARVPTPIKEMIKDIPDWLNKNPEDKARQDHVKNGRMLFTERGCLACHSHDGTGTALDNLPAVSSKAQFAPNLSQTAAKIAPENGDADGKWRWLIQWITNPSVYHPRTRMPVTHLSKDEAAEIAAWLMSQPVKDYAKDPETPSTETLSHLAGIWLEKATDQLVAEDILARQGLSPDQEKAMRAQKPDADELRLAQSRADSWDDKLKWYVGKKAISQLGCYGCHDIPGFETSKPIGTPLNDWGKKDPERLAFEDVLDYAQKHNHIVMQRDNPRDPKQPSMDWRVVEDNGQNKRPYEEFFYEALAHRQRDGFLHQKLMEPRSYDHARQRKWDERLRMPQFQFGRSLLTQEASPEERARAERDEAEAREDVMTFILGLIAEPIPLKFVYEAPAEKLAIARGKQVLDKFNCAGCHVLTPGTYDFKPNDETRDYLESKVYDPKSSDYASNHRDPFKDQSEWTGQPQPNPDRLVITGVPDPVKENQIWLTEALRITTQAKENRDVPAWVPVVIPAPGDGLFSRQDPHGGTFAHLLVPYLAAKKDIYKDYKTARAALPPPLLREGEKAQPGWLFQFLRDPIVIRPMTAEILRMPRFNMSPEEAMTLVNYFAAVDKIQNPAGGLSAPYAAVPQRNNDYWQDRTAAYVAALKKEDLDTREKELREVFGDWLVKERLADLEAKIPAAKKAVDSAKEKDAQEIARQFLTKLVTEFTELKDAARQQQARDRLLKAPLQEWRTEEAYATDALRLLTNYNNDCLGCHSIGRINARQGKETQGPNLELSWQRLRPEWTGRWLANPERMISYPTPMPANFVKNKPDVYPEFVGTPFQKAMAVRDVLMAYPNVTEKPVNRFYLPATVGGASK
jgi:mono/diheme cytochrome c family protein